MQIQSIRIRRNFYALSFMVSIFLAVWFSTTFVIESTFAVGAISVAFLVLLVRENRFLHAAALIWDNRILAVQSVHISTSDGQRKNDTESTVVSTFGMLIGRKIYRWGCDGLYGVRLNTIEIDKERMYLTFGDAVQTMRVELLHGMTQQQAVLDVAQKLWRETRVRANITGW